MRNAMMFDFNGCVQSMQNSKQTLNNRGRHGFSMEKSSQEKFE